jgi:intein/homing endonuclease
MKFYVTIEGTPRLKKSFLNLKLFSILYIPEILEQYGYTYSTIDDYGSFIISNQINELIKTYAKSKRIRGIIYSNPDIDENILPNIFDTLADIQSISEVVLMDDYNVPKLTHLYSNFDEIVFFPSIKKIRLIECQKISNLQNIEWKSK